MVVHTGFTARVRQDLLYSSFAYFDINQRVPFISRIPGTRTTVLLKFGRFYSVRCGRLFIAIKSRGLWLFLSVQKILDFEA